MVWSFVWAGCGHSDTHLVAGDGTRFELWQGSETRAATVLLFVRTDCPISNRYAPTIRSLHSTYQSRGVDFFLVYVDPKEISRTIEEHLARFEIPCRGVLDPLHELVKKTEVTVTPEAVVFDSLRNIVYRGRIDDLYVAFGQARPEPTTHELADALDAVLAGEPVAEPATTAIGCYIGDLE
jgi:Redoxin